MRIYLTLLAAFAFSGAATSQTVGSEQRTHRASQGDSTGIVSTTLPGNGSVDFIDADHLKKGLVTNSVNELNGQAAGVVVSSAADRMAMLSSVRVRGTTSLTGGNDPLVIIDGVYSDLTTLIGIYPADIESFTILKNAAETAPFGSRGASGVIVVATKKGKNQKFQIAYDTNMGFERVFKTLNMLKAADYLATADRLGLTSMTRGTEDTDFQRGITRTGLVQNHHIAFSGGNEKSNYRASLGFMDHNTVVRVNKYQTFTAKVDLQQKAFSDLLAIDLGMFASTQRNEYIYDQQKLFYSAAAQNPSLPFGSKKTGWQRNANASQINPPGALLEDKKHERQQTVNTHLGLDFDLSRYIAIEGRDASLQPSFHVKAFGSYSNSSIANNEFQPTWTSGDGKIMRKEEKNEDWLGNLMVNFSNQWGIHKLSATALTEYHRAMRRGFWTTVKGLTNNSMGYDGVAGGAIIPYGDTGSDYESPSLLSFLGMAEYTLLNAYTLSATVRADGSSLFGANNRWGVFPSVSASWDVLKTFSIPQLTMLKLRTGYGLSGNLGGIESYNTLMLIRPSGVVPWEDTPQVTFAQLSNINPDLKWETRSSFNIGLDVGTWNNRLVLTAEYYYSRTRDMLYQYEVPVPPFPYNKWVANLGKMSNQGFEIGLGITPILKRDLELNINVNMSFQKNRLISLQRNGEPRGRRRPLHSRTGHAEDVAGLEHIAAIQGFRLLGADERCLRTQDLQRNGSHLHEHGFVPRLQRVCQSSRAGHLRPACNRLLSGKRQLPELRLRHRGMECSNQEGQGGKRAQAQPLGEQPRYHHCLQRTVANDQLFGSGSDTRYRRQAHLSALPQLLSRSEHTVLTADN